MEENKKREIMLVGIKEKEKIDAEIKAQDRSIKGFPSFVLYGGEGEFESGFLEYLDEYKRYFITTDAFKNDQELINNISENIVFIKEALKYYKNGRIDKAVNQIASILEKYVNDLFFVSELEKSYAIKQVAYFEKYQSENYNYREMQNHSITLFRGRESEEELVSRRSMLNRPYEEAKSYTRQRFTYEEISALFLSSTSFTCWKELGKPDNNFYVSAFIPDEKGEKRRILNLVIIEEVMTGIYDVFRDGDNSDKKNLQNKMVAFWPLVRATSDKVKSRCQQEEMTEYIIPELVTRSLKRFGIDGIAYLSKLADHDTQIPLCVNIVFPIGKEESNEEGYGKITEELKMTKPEKFSHEKNVYSKYTEGSYVYDIYCDAKKGDPLTILFNGKERKYGDTSFAYFDNYLVQKEMKYYMNEEEK